MFDLRSLGVVAMDVRSACVLSTLVLVSVSKAAAEPVGGWRPPRTPEIREAARIAKEVGDPKPVYSVRGDFDGDGQPDRASLLVNTATGEFGVFIRRGNGVDARLSVAGESWELARIVLSVEPPGEYKPTCAGSPPCRPAVTARWPVLGIAYSEASFQIFFWNGADFANEFLAD